MLAPVTGTEPSIGDPKSPKVQLKSKEVQSREIGEGTWGSSETEVVRRQGMNSK